ncbi:MAG: hypothetical protein IPM13_10050 [Phycisphaerales bacterium]|nr:hypothetical protein [Phycisphaerales bacterium]
MSDSVEQVETCAACGASIYPEHIARGLADHWQGQLLCVHCLREQKGGSATGGEAERPADPLGDPIELVPEEETSTVPGLVGGVKYDTKPTAIKSFGGGPGGMTAGSLHEARLKRPLDPAADTATRCRTFHCKLADAAFAHMNDQINDWVDAHEDVRIKFVTSCIGVVEGKHADPHLIVTVFY